MSQVNLNEAMTIIADELHSLLSDVSNLKEVYGEVAAASDLTFIKILEHKYEILMEEIDQLAEAVSEVKISEYVLEGIGHGR